MNYAVLTPLRGYRRADGCRAPIDAGEVVRLPADTATDALLGFGAIKPTDAEETCPIEHVSVVGQSSGQITEAFSPASLIAVVAVTDRYALIGAIEDLGGMVFFGGEGLPDDAELVLADFSNEQMLDELSRRVDEGRLMPTLMASIADVVDNVDDADGASLNAVEVEDGLASAPVIAAPTPTLATADVKPTRKPKVATK